MITILKRIHVYPFALIWIRLIALVQMTHYHRDERGKNSSDKMLTTSIIPAHLYPTDSYGFYTQYRKMPSAFSSTFSLSTATTNSYINVNDTYHNNNEQQLYAIFKKSNISEEYTESFNDNNIYTTNNDTTMIKINQYQPINFHIQQKQHYHQQHQQQHQQHHQHMIISTCQTVCACKWKGGKQTVECIDRLLMKIPDNIDGSTQVLDMSGNKFHTLLNEQFIRANLLNLQKLYLRNCQIMNIEVQTFKGLTNLVELDLSQNTLKIVPSKALSHLSSLRDLTLSSNRINKIESNAFAGVPALHKLDLSHCDLNEIAAQAFEGLDDLTLLRLNGNQLNELLPKTIETLSRLHGIELHDNPWICDCRLRDAKLWLMEKNIPYPVAPICSGGPERFIERTFSDLNINDFACRPEMLAISQFIEATTGENASILCRAKAIPAPNISWYWNGRLLSNNTVFSSNQRLYILEYGGFVKISQLLLTNAQEIDSSEFFCVAENNAGTTESNFTLHVRMRAIGMESLAGRHIIGLSATLMGLIVFVLVFVLFLAMRLRRENYTPSKTTNHLEVITNMNHHQNMVITKPQTQVLKNSTSSTTLCKNAIMQNNIQLNTQLDKKDDTTDSVTSMNPLQKPPRLTDMTYGNNSYDKSNTLLATSTGLISPTTSIVNNPDLINDTKRFENDEHANMKTTIAATKTNLTQDLFGDFSMTIANSNYIEKHIDNSTLYPSTLWQDLLNTSSICTSSADDIFLRRYMDKTPILETHKELYDRPNSTMNAECFSKTFPRVNCGSNIITTDTSVHNVLSLEGTNSTASTTTTNLSNSGSGVALLSGYPTDYGLPLVHGAELFYNHHLPRHPLRDLNMSIGIGTRTATGATNSLEYEISDTSSTYNNNNINNNSNNNNSNNNNSYNKRMNPRYHHYRPHNGLSTLISQTLPRHKDTNTIAIATSNVGPFLSSTLTSNSDNLNSANTNSNSNSNSNPNSNSATISNVHNSVADIKTNIESHVEMNNPILNSKTIRVWQKGGVPVLPPLSAIKRALISNNRNNSPDEGYQEGCGTNV